MAAGFLIPGNGRKPTMKGDKMKDLKTRQAERIERAKQNGSPESTTKLVYGDGSPQQNGGMNLGNGATGLNPNDGGEPNPPGSAAYEGIESGRSLALEAGQPRTSPQVVGSANDAGLNGRAIEAQTNNAGPRPDIMNAENGANNGGTTGGNGGGNPTPVDYSAMRTHAELDGEHAKLSTPIDGFADMKVEEKQAALTKANAPKSGWN